VALQESHDFALVAIKYEISEGRRQQQVSVSMMLSQPTKGALYIFLNFSEILETVNMDANRVFFFK